MRSPNAVPTAAPTTLPSPLADRWAPDPPDEDLVASSVAGDRDALEALLRRHERWIYNLALRMLQAPQDAEDATQECLMKLVTHLATFRGESAFRTWAWRLAVRHVLDRRRSKPEEVVTGFECYAHYLDAAPDEAPPADERLVVEEARVSCTLGMLLCLDREQRLAFVLGELFEVSDAVASEVLEISRDGFRQRLARARRQLREFMQGRCGLVDPANPCRCARKTRAFIRDGIVDPGRLVFARDHVARMREASARGRAGLEAALDAGNRALWAEHPFLESPDLVARVRAVLAGPLRERIEPS
jgi:RNA polymerase sigma factor (sigma-70 family)